MKKELLLFTVLCGFCITVFLNKETIIETPITQIKSDLGEKKIKKTVEEKQMTIEQRTQFEFNMQKNPLTGIIPEDEKIQELEVAIAQRNEVLFSKDFSSSYVSRGPTNLGGRTRAFAVDLDNPSIMMAGGVSSGLFRSTDAGASWTKVSSNDEVHNVTAIAQDPRPGNRNTWYYGTGENFGNSASLGRAIYAGQGVWKSIDNGLSWNLIPLSTTGTEAFDSVLDIVDAMAVHPITGELYVASFRFILAYDSSNNRRVVISSQTGSGSTDVKITPSGRVYVAFSGGTELSGIHTSPNGTLPFTQITQDGTDADPNSGIPTGWFSRGRLVLGIAPSNENVVYALYRNGQSGASTNANPMVEADLWRFTLTSNLNDPPTGTWTNFTSKLPDEPGGSTGNDPFAIQLGYDIEVSVKPDDENFVVIGGTNVYRIADINTDVMFNRIGGYVSSNSYAAYSEGGSRHHPDIHDLAFSPTDADILFSGTDGGVHRTDVTAATVEWTSLNNNYQTYQYYHVDLDPLAGSDFIIGGAQDNGTTLGGAPSLTGVESGTEMQFFAGGDGVSVAIGRTGNGTNYNDIQLYYGFQLGPIRTRRGNQFFDIQPRVTDNTPSDQTLFITYFHLDKENNVLYYVSGETMYRTLDGLTVTKDTWTDIGDLPTGEFIRSMATTTGVYNASTSYSLIGGQNGGVFRHENPQGTNLGTAINITPTGATVANNSVVSDVAIHPTNPDIAMVVYSNYGIDNIFYTENVRSNNPTWVLVERNLEAHSIRSVVIGEFDGDISYFVGTARGLYKSLNPTTTDWELEGADQIGLAVVSSLKYREADDVLLVGTHGNGMFQGNFATLSTPENSIDENAITMYPNPASSQVTIGYTGLEQLQKVNISDINGKLIMQLGLENFNNYKEINIRQLTTGIYFVKIFDNKGSSSVKKLIVR